MKLRAESIRFGYGNKEDILSNVDFEIQSGEIIGLMGKSGIGKTTLAKILAGYEKPKSGQLIYEGLTVESGKPHPVQLIFQHPEKAVNPKWKMDKMLKESGVDYEPLLKPLGIDPTWLSRWPNELSGGELQRFCVLRALHPNTKFIIADEITAMLDAVTQLEIWRFLIDYAAKQQMGIIAISHDAILMKHICHKIITF